MRKNRIKSVGIALMLATTSLSTVYVYDARVHSAVAQTVQSEADARKIIDKFFSKIMALPQTPTYGKIEISEGGKKITVSDLQVKTQNLTGKYKTLEISNYVENESSGEYSADQVVVRNVEVEMDKAYQEKLQKEMAKTNPALAGQNTPMEPVKIADLSYNTIKGSYKENFVSIEGGKMNGFSMKMPEGTQGKTIDVSFSADFEKFKVTQMDKLAKFNEKYTAITDPMHLPTEFGQDLASISESFSIKRMSLTGFPEFPGEKAGQIFKIGEVSIENWDKGVIGEMAIGNINVSDPNDPTLQSGKFGKIAVKNIKIADLYRLLPQMVPAPGASASADPMAGLKMLQLVGGFSMSGIELKGPQINLKGNFGFDWSNFVGYFPTKIAMTSDTTSDFSQAQQPVSQPGQQAPGADVVAMLKSVGITKLDSKYELNLAWDEASKRLTLSPHFSDIEQLFKLELTASIGNLPKELFLLQDPNQAAVLAMGANVGPITLELTDKGAQKIYEAQAKGSWEGISAGFANDPTLKPVVDNVTKFVNAPKGKLKIVLKPKTEVTFVQLSAAAAIDPMSSLALFDIETSHSQ